MPLLSVEGIILRRTNFGEADRIISVLTPTHGQLSAIARGVRRPKSKLAGGLELFAVCELTIAEGRGDMGVVTSARLKHFFGSILHDYDRLTLGYEMIKMINRATTTVAEAEFYDLLHNGFRYLDDLDINGELIELWFRLQLTTLLGHGLNTQTDRQGDKLQAGKTYNYDTQEHAFYEHAPGSFTSEHIKLLRLSADKNPKVLAQVGGVEPVLSDCLGLARTIDG